MATLQVRSLDDQLYEALGRRAAMDNRSISQEVTAMLKEYLSTPVRKNNKATDLFLEMCGCWDDERGPEEITREIRQARQTSTRFNDGYLEY
jgi:plasmid stability protein